MTPVKTIDNEIHEYIISIFTDNQVGVLARITGIFTRRKINIESLRVSETQHKGTSKFTIHAFTNEDTIGRVVAGIERIIEVHRTDYHQVKE